MWVLLDCVTCLTCLLLLCSYCGVKDPSWAELRYFVWFLDQQLESCEKSVFCDEEFVGDVMAGLKTFVVKFMIQMSRVSPIISYLFSSLFFPLLFCALLSCYWVIFGRTLPPHH